MFARRDATEHPRGQMAILMAVVLSLIVFAVGLVIDGGNGLAQRRASQNASDFGAVAGARVIADYIAGDTTNGTDANVEQAILSTVAANGGAIALGAPAGPRYVDANGAILGYVGAGLPATAVGVAVNSNRDWKPFFLGLFGIDKWITSADATAKGGWSLSGPPPGTIFPVGIAENFFRSYPSCTSDQISTDPSDPCYPQHLTPGNLNVPGGFGWLKFGCDGYGLGQDPPANAGGCGNSKPFLQGEIDGLNSYGCCSAISTPGLDRIGSLPGNKVSADCSYYITNKIHVTVPIWDIAGGTGSNAWYHIVGYAGFQLTSCSGGKNIEGVWREPFFTGPVTSTRPSGVVQPLGVELVR
jgi:Putative Flp pilus-assembly TadE/G-like